MIQLDLQIHSKLVNTHLCMWCLLNPLCVGGLCVCVCVCVCVCTLEAASDVQMYSKCVSMCCGDVCVDVFVCVHTTSGVSDTHKTPPPLMLVYMSVCWWWVSWWAVGQGWACDSDEVCLLCKLT